MMYRVGLRTGKLYLPDTDRTTIEECCRAIYTDSYEEAEKRAKEIYSPAHCTPCVEYHGICEPSDVGYCPELEDHTMIKAEG